MKTRIITALVLLCIFIPVLILSHTVVFPFFLSLVSLLAVYEYIRCLGFEKDYKISLPTLFLALALPTASVYIPKAYLLLSLFAVATVYLLYLFSCAVFMKGKMTFSSTCAIFTGVSYIVTAIVSVALLRRSFGGEYLYILVFVGAWVTDSFAYFTGRFFGRHKLIVEISPKKTVEGSIGGIVFCVLAYILFGFIVGKTVGVTPNYLALSLSAIPISIIAQIGDLIFSLIKREHNVKDYGNIFPGHGGMLDRIDSIIPVAILLYILVSVGGGFAFFV